MTAISLRNIAPTVVRYDVAQTAGVTLVALSALASILALIYLFIFERPKAKTFRNNHIFGYFICLLTANFIEAMGSIVNFHWVAIRGAHDGTLCSLQGAVKQAGNISTSFWSLTISVHVFLLLFFQLKSNKATFIAIIAFTWSFTLAILLVGRFVLQSKHYGPYFGVAEKWCDVTANYQSERIFLECFFALLTITISFVLYSLIFLRVRGILSITKDKKWVFVPTDKAIKDLQLVTSQMAMNDSMLNIAKKMVWYPVSYTAVMLPMTLIRILEYKYNVPFGFTVMSGIVFNSMGLVNVILVIYIDREFKKLDSCSLPQSTAERTWRSATPTEKFMAERLLPMRDENLARSSVVRLSLVDLPTAPGNTYIAPASWKTTYTKGLRDQGITNDGHDS